MSLRVCVHNVNDKKLEKFMKSMNLNWFLKDSSIRVL